MRRLEPALFGLAALVAYVLLAADSFYKTDGIDIVRLLDAHLQAGAPLDHPWHVGYLPALFWFRSLLMTCGLSPDYLQLGAWFSAFGAALGVGFARAGMARLGIKDAVARFATTAFALSPGVLTFATVVEFHGPMLAPLGLAFWWTARLIGKPSWWGMVVLGALCHLPFLVHSQQLFLPVWLLAFFVMKRGFDRESLSMAAVAGVVHGALAFGLPQLLPGYGHWSDLGAGFAAESSIGRPQSLDYTLQIFWQEWLWPQLPLSLFAFTAALSRSLRREFIAFVIGFVPFLYLSVRQLVFEPEFGAYMLPMVLPAAMLTAQRFGTRWSVWLLLPLGLYQWVTGPQEHLLVQKKGDAWFYAEVLRAADGATPFVLVGSHSELGSAFARLEPGQLLWVRTNAAMPREQATASHFLGVESYLRGMHDAGRAVLITDVAMKSLEDPRQAMLDEKATLEVPANDAMAGPLFAEHLRSKFAIIKAGSPDVWQLVPK